MAISFKGYGENVLTFNANFSEVGVPVSVGGDDLIFKANAEMDFIGVISYADEQHAGVIMDGYVELPFTGTAPLFGWCNLVANGSGGVKTPNSGTTSNHFVRVLKVDTEKRIVGFIL